MATYLVTGGAGFIGSHLVDALIARGETVRVVDNFATGSREYIESVRDQITFYEVDITDLEALREPMEGVDYVLHQAAIPSVPRSIDNPIATHESCATGTLNVLIAARDAKVKRVVYAASSSAYGDNQSEYKSEDMPPRPLSPYAVAKLVGEQYCQVFYTVYGLETVSLRYFNVFGPRQNPDSPYAAVIPRFIKAMLAGKQPTIFGDGTQSRDFTYIDNIVEGNLLACKADARAAGRVINLACGDNINLLELVAAINDLLGTCIEPIFDAPRPGDVKHTRADNRLARELLGFTPVVSFEEGLRRTLAWLRDAQFSHI
ncbi:MAG: SDR family oxidoreductase [Anaerolineae bacterium]|nr:SDR family oxidoreductase [Anaerolineae bacterium]